MKWKDDGDHGIQEVLYGVANFCTLIVPAFAMIGVGLIGDAVHACRKGRNEPTPDQV